jgi:hypothetical protein
LRNKWIFSNLIWIKIKKRLCILNKRTNLTWWIWWHLKNLEYDGIHLYTPRTAHKCMHTYTCPTANEFFHYGCLTRAFYVWSKLLCNSEVIPLSSWLIDNCLQGSLSLPDLELGSWSVFCILQINKGFAFWTRN